jgi:hypothetical protein
VTISLVLSFLGPLFGASSTGPFIDLVLGFFFFFDMSAQEGGGGIRTSDLRFIRRPSRLSYLSETLKLFFVSIRCITGGWFMILNSFFPGNCHLLSILCSIMI